jgi:hypothetical protein
MKITKSELKSMIRELVQESTEEIPKYSLVTYPDTKAVTIFKYNGEGMYNPQLLGTKEIRKELGAFEGQTITIRAYDQIGKRKPKNLETLQVEVIVSENDNAGDVMLVAEDGEIRFAF